MSNSCKRMPLGMEKGGRAIKVNVVVTVIIIIIIIIMEDC